MWPALIADDAAMLHALVFAAQALPVRYRTEDAGAEQTIALRFERPVVDGFRFCYLSMAPTPDLLGGRQGDADGIEIRNQIRSVVR